MKCWHVEIHDRRATSRKPVRRFEHVKAMTASEAEKFVPADMIKFDYYLRVYQCDKHNHAGCEI